MAYELRQHYWRSLDTALDYIERSEELKEFKLDKNSKVKILELGTYEGGSACVISDRLLKADESILFTVDHFRGSEEHRADKRKYPELQRLEATAHLNIAKSKNAGRVRVLNLDLWESFGEISTKVGYGVDLLYVDASRKQNSVMRNLALYYPLVKCGGLIVLANYEDPAVNLTVNAALSSFMEISKAALIAGQFWGIKL